MNVALVVPALPSVTVTSLIESVGGVVVVDDRPDALGVGDGRVRGAAEVHEERLVRLDRGVAVRPATVTLCVVAPGGKVSVPEVAV